MSEKEIFFCNTVPAKTTLLKKTITTYNQKGVNNLLKCRTCNKLFTLLLLKKLLVLTIAKIVPKLKRLVIKRRLYFTIVLILIFTLPFKVYSQKGTRIRTVVIDAGHGGKDPGALGKHSREKDITLKVALKLGKYISTHLPDVKVIYTRKTDKFIPLKKRGEIANKNHADVFISIHCNSNPSSRFYGAETYVLGSDPSRTKRNMKVAMLENAAILLEDNAQSNYNGFDPNSPESYIIFSLKQNDYKQNQSLILADKIQKQFKDRVGRKDRGVYQAGFLVLAGTYMPSVLVELGYLSNPTEEKYLLSNKGQSYLASAIYRAFKEYKKNYEKDNDAFNYRKTILSGNKKEKNNVKIKKTTKPVNKLPEFRVQFYTNSKKIPLSSSRFSKINNIKVYFHNGLYKYTTGNYKNFLKALSYQKKIRSLGYHDAFVVAFLNGKRISINKAKKMIKH